MRKRFRGLLLRYKGILLKVCRTMRRNSIMRRAHDPKARDSDSVCHGIRTYSLVT